MARLLRLVCGLALAAAAGCSSSGGSPGPPDRAVVPSSPSASAPPVDTVGTHPAGLGDLAAASRRVPVGLRIPALGIDAPVLEVGLPADGQLAVPDDNRRVGWYGGGAVPGTSGTALIAAHVDHARRPGVFFHLDRLSPGATVLVDDADGRVTAFRVVAKRTIEKSRLPVAALTTTGGPPVLVLVTCGGKFDRARHSYEENVLVYAVPS